MKKRRTIHLGSNIYVDTDNRDYILEYSLCKQYLRVIKVDDWQTCGWIDIDASIRHAKDYQFIHYSYKRKYPIMLKFVLYINE
jgi:hypothetical protein